MLRKLINWLSLAFATMLTITMAVGTIWCLQDGEYGGLLVGSIYTCGCAVLTFILADLIKESHS